MDDKYRIDRTKLKKGTLQEQGSDEKCTHLTPSECFLAVWPLTLAAWSWKEPNIAERRIQRDVVRITRGKR